ncbi:TMP-TENI-domain-containing protein [Tothia fuscella]|uniref:TMP-TENI-domain-containing protein n=1 Tax=Tothia fuscella TaxID=1048955 RepID=A0A9P4NXW6_9PEZI|nr:TMP-TENI-domain-containing protein [Tothia fuscella]
MVVDYSLYLVTDSTKAILKDGHLPSIVKAAIEGGVTIVQYRDKTSDTADLIKNAKELHAITKQYGVPLLINDRVDVAIASGVEGVHIGQDDMDLATARNLLGKDAIIGVTAQSEEEALRAAGGDADYLGLGTVFATPTKENTKSIVGCAGVRSMLSALSVNNHKIKTVCIGGINASNVQRVLYQTGSSDGPSLDGVAVVSAIIAASDPKESAQELKSLITSPAPFATSSSKKTDITTESVPEAVKKLGEVSPLCHNMTNLVVQNFAANVAICIGASPIMSNNGLEARDLAKLGGSLVVNMGTVTPEGVSNYLLAVTAYNAAGGPVVFDPVGAGATQQRRDAVKTLMAEGYFDLIKGNEGEIKTVAGMRGEQQKGVDSGASTLSMEEKSDIVRSLAHRERNVVLMTGKVDILSDGQRIVFIENGHEYLANITGSGCTLGTTISAFMAVNKDDKMLAALAGILMYEIAAEVAARRDDVRGPGTFVPVFLDELYAIRENTQKGDHTWLKAARTRSGG